MMGRGKSFRSKPARVAYLMRTHRSAILGTMAVLVVCALIAANPLAKAAPRERIMIDDDWRFQKGDPAGNAVSLLYDVRTEVKERWDGGPADAQAKELANVTAPAQTVIKAWILPTGNTFIKDPARRFVRPKGNWGGDVAYVQRDFDDRAWQQVNLPHDWAIAGPFVATGGGGMGRLPTAGVGWYRKKAERPGGGRRQVHLSRRRRRDVVRDGLAQWPPRGRLAVWLFVVARRPHAVCGFRRRESIGDPVGQSAGLVALVSRRRHLSPCLADQDRARACGPMGYLGDDAGCFRRFRDHRRGGHDRQ